MASLDDMREPGDSYCRDCPDHEACFEGYPCEVVRKAANDFPDESVNIVAYKPRYPVIDYLPLMSTGVHWKYEQAARRIKPGNAVYDFLVENNLFDSLDDFPVRRQP